MKFRYPTPSPRPDDIAGGNFGADEGGVGVWLPAHTRYVFSQDWITSWSGLQGKGLRE